MNPFQTIINITEKSKWYSLDDFVTICEYQLRLAGIDWSNAFELTAIMIEMVECGFIEYNPDDPLQVRPLERFYESV